MKNNYLPFYLIVITLIFSNCQKGKIGNKPTYEKLEKAIRAGQDKRAVFTYSQYEELLKIISDTNFIVLPINEFKDSVNNDKIMFGMRHDVDCHPFKALEMAKMEQKYNVRSTFYILATAKYYGKFTKEGVNRFRCLDDLYIKINKLGNEIAIHNDLLVVMIEKGLDPLKFNREELEYYKSIGIKVNGSVAHGSSLASQTVPNFHIFSEYAESDFVEYEGKKYKIGEYTMTEYGFDYEANFVSHTKYFTDSGGTWRVGSFNDMIERIKQAKAGDRIQMLAHPVWWGKK